MKRELLLFLRSMISYSYFILFQTLSCIFHSRRSRRGLLFINTGDLGDNVLTLSFLTNVINEVGENNLYVLVKEPNHILYNHLDIKINILKWNRRRYKYNPVYRTIFLIKLRWLNVNKTFNITAERGMLNDEISILSGAVEIICLSSMTKYIPAFFARRMNKRYTTIIQSGHINEYDRLQDIIKYLGIKTNVKLVAFNKIDKDFIEFKDTIVIAPLSSDRFRNWRLENYRTLCKELSKNYQIILLGSLKQRKALNRISLSNENIINLAGLVSFSEIYSIIKNGLLFIGNDSGLTHIALTTGSSIIAIIGGGCFNRFFPFNEDEKTFFLYDDLDCFGCNWNCKYIEPYCLTNITVEQVLERVNELVKKH